MSLALVYTKKDVKSSEQDVTSHTQVPNNNYAKLMYYLCCVGDCYPAIKSIFGARLIDYKNYTQLSTAEKSAVVSYAELYHPDKIAAFKQVDNVVGGLV